jgi:Zn-dependent protease
MDETAKPPRPNRQPGIRIFRVFGIPVYLSVSWLVLAVLVTAIYGGMVRRSLPGLSALAAYAVGFGFVACLVVSVFLHELGHAVVSRRSGIAVRAISLEMLGGFTEMAEESPTPRIELAVALVGPAVSAVLGVLGWIGVALLDGGTVIHQLMLQVALSNVIVAVFNVLPGLPLDGGRALRAVVWAISGDRFLGTRVAGYVGRGVAAVTLVGCGVAVWFGYLQLVGVVFGALVGSFLWVAAGQSVRAGRIGARFGLVNVGRLARPALLVPADLSVAETIRRVHETGAGAVVVADSAGRPLAVVNEQAAAAVPVDRLPWVPVTSVARQLRPSLLLDAELAGEDVMHAVQRDPATEYLVVAGPGGEHIVGVLIAADLANLLDPKGTIR